MSAKLTCKSKDPETGVCTFTFEYPGDKRVITFSAPFEEI